jgi:hypothetical protein
MLAQQLHRNQTLVGGWSSRWRWQRRLDAYLQHQEEERFRQVERDIRELNRRHLEAGELLRNKAVERLEELDTSRLTIDSVIGMLKLGIQIERQALGMDKPPVARASTKSTLAEVSLSETRELTSEIREKIQKLPPVSRDIMRQITAKTLRLIQFQTETFEEWDSDAGNIAGVPRQPAEEGHEEANPSEKDGAQQSD